VLLELRIENLLLIESAQLELTPGFNVITGETGAGKTVLTHALDLLLGGKHRPDIIRPGAEEAYVEGIFELTDELNELLGELISKGEEELIIVRKVARTGRSRALINGRSVTIKELQQIAESLLSFFGQHEQRKLTVTSAQLEILDSYCGEQQLLLRKQCAELYRKRSDLLKEKSELTQIGFDRERETELLRNELAQIQAAADSLKNHSKLLAERERLRNFEALRIAASAANNLLDSDGEGPAANPLLSAAVAQLETVDRIDPNLDKLTKRLRAVQLETVDVASDLRSYLEGADASPELLDQLEQALELVNSLLRRHGGSVETVFAYEQVATKRLADLENAESNLAEINQGLSKVEAELDEIGKALSEQRQKHSTELASSVEAVLTELAMPDAVFEVTVSRGEQITARGLDNVEFKIAANKGLLPGPVKEIASGGEVSRVMLALLTVSHQEGVQTLIFDEIDAGIGGITARSVGELVVKLAGTRQILLITHLPQIAALAETHFSVVKEAGEETAKTTIKRLREEQVVDELVRMLGAEANDQKARAHAKELLA